MDNQDTPQIITHIEHNINHCVFDCKWVPCSAKFVVIGSLPKGSGTLEIFEITSGELKKVKEIERPNSFKCGTFGASSDIERRLATGDFKGTLEIWFVFYIFFYYEIMINILYIIQNVLVIFIIYLNVS